MNMEEILGEAFKIGSDAKFNVCVDDLGVDSVYKEMTYIELGTFLIGAQKDIELIDIKLKIK